jgi:hypothetical protein
MTRGFLFANSVSERVVVTAEVGNRQREMTEGVDTEEIAAIHNVSPCGEV